VLALPAAEAAPAGATTVAGPVTTVASSSAAVAIVVSQRLEGRRAVASPYESLV